MRKYTKHHRPTPSGKYDDDEYNRFQRNARSRANAYRSRSIPVHYLEWRNDAEEIFDLAEEKLRRFLMKTKRMKTG